MLILTRPVGTAFKIGGNVTVTVVEVRNRRASLAVMVRGSDPRVLAGCVGESLRVDDKSTVTVMNIRGRQVSVGVMAPRDVRILREELCG